MSGQTGLLPRTNNSALTTGAVGGPKGFAAGTAQVLLQFITQYDKGRLEELSRQLQGVNAAQSLNAQRLQAHETRLAGLVKAGNAVQAARTKLIFDGTEKAKLALAYQDKFVAAQKAGITLSADEKTQRTLLLDSLVQRNLLDAQDVAALQNEVNFARQRAVAEADVNAAKARGAQLTAEQLALERQQAAVSGRPSAASRLGSLGLGLVAGTFGGLAVSAALQPVLDIVGKIGEAFEDIVNPAKKAGEAVSDVADAVEEIGSDENLSNLEKAARLLERMNAPQQFAGRLAGAPDVEVAKEAAAQQQKIRDFLVGEQQLREQIGYQLLTQTRDLQLQAALEEAGVDRASQVVQMLGSMRDLGVAGPLDTLMHLLGQPGINDILGINAETAAAAYDTAVATQRAVAHAEQYKRELQEAADAASDLRSELAGAALDNALDARTDAIRSSLDATVDSLRNNTGAAIDHIRDSAEIATDTLRRQSQNQIDLLQDKLDRLELVPSGRTKALEAQLDKLKDSGPSKQTNALAEAIERMNKAQEEAAFRAQLADIAEQKHAIQLRERLRLTRGAIDLDNFHGKDRLIAIEALLDKQRKQNEAVDRFNKLLEIQYQIQQGVRRQQGETIREFTERRAQYYRGLLQQAADLNRAGPQAELEAERARVSASVQLKELEERRRKIIEDRARQLRLRSLQEQLRASQERDRKELESRRESLQKQLEASRKADQQALEAKRKAIQDEIEAVRRSTADHIDAINKRRDAEIDARERARDVAINTAQRAAEAAIAAEERRAELIKQLTSQAEADRLRLAFSGAQNMAELQRFAGALAGVNFSEAYIRAQLSALGVDPASQQTILANLTNLRNAYSDNLQRLRGGWAGLSSSGGFAEGGIFRLNNSNTPIGKDIRWGDGQGDELGMNLGHGMGAVLSNKVVQALRENGSGGPLVGGDMIINTGEDPWRARYNWRRTGEDLVADVIRR